MEFKFSNEARIEKLKEAFLRATECAPAERSQVLADLKTEDSELFDEVLRLAAEQDRAGDYLAPLVSASRTISEESPNQPLFDPGDRVCGRYEIIRLIGTGGMGEVYEAEDPNLARRVALKTVRLDRLSDPRLQERLRREAVLALQITHPNVCRILDLNWHDVPNARRVAVLTMVLLEGKTLAALLKENGRFTTAQAMPLVLQMAAALEASHGSGVVHRDFKPSNVMLCGEHIVVTDFGLAVAEARAPGDTLTSLGQVLGTPEYMAPEQLQTGEATVRSDIYSLGVVMFEMVTGVRPTRGSTGFDELIKRFLDPVRSPRALNRDVSPRWERVIVRALERDPLRRYPSVKHLADDLTSGRLLLTLPTRRTVWSSLGSVAVVALSIGGFRYWQQGVQIAPGALCMITPMSNGTGDSRLAGFSTLLLSQLEQSNHIRPWNPARLAEALARMRKTSLPQPAADAAAWREVALREGVPLVAFGSISAVAEEFILHMRLEVMGTSPGAPARHWEKDFRAASLPMLMEISRDVVNWIRIQAGEMAEAINARSRPPAALTSASWDALSLYQQGDEIARTEPERAIPLLTEAARIDPDFVLAQMRLGDILVTLRRWDEGLPCWEAALTSARRQHLSEREELRLQARYALEIGDYSAGEAAALRWATAYPADELPRWLVFSSRYTMGNLSEARDALNRLITRTDEGRRLRLFAEAQYYLAQADADRLAEVARVMSNIGEAENSVRLEGIARAIGGDYDGAKSAFSRLTQFSSASARSRGFLLLSVLDSSRGELDEADASLASGISQDEGSAQRSLWAGKLVARAYLAWIREYPQRARSLALDAAGVTNDADVRTRARIVLLRCGFAADAARLSSTLTVPERYPRFRALRDLADGEELLSIGRFSDAVSKIEQALRQRPSSHPPESLLYALSRSGDRVRYSELAERAVRRPVYTWSSPEQQFGPVTLLTNKLGK